MLDVRQRPAPIDHTLRQAFVARFGYLVDDVIGDDTVAAADRVRLPLLVYYPVMLLDRVALATIFGFFDSAASSELLKSVGAVSVLSPPASRLA